MPSTAKRLAAVLLVACLACSSAVLAQDPRPAATQDPRPLMAKANAAYEAKDFATAARLFVEAASISSAKAGNHYNAACSYALAGRPDEAFAELQASIDTGLSGASSPASDTDFTSLHADPRWAPLVARFEAAHPEIAAVKALRDEKVSIVRRFAMGRHAIAEGASVTNHLSLFNQFLANQAQYLGSYDEASALYGYPSAVDDAVAAGYTHAADALPVVLARAHGQRAVFLNEAHGQSQTRAANYALLAGLRADGFDVLAMESLKPGPTTARDATHCSNTTLLDAGLVARGYAVPATAFYALDPVYAETVREALRLGFRLVAYDSLVENGVAPREQNQADNLACVFKDDPKARLVVIAGFSHIAERRDFWVPGGAMAARFRVATGIDPLTVDSTTQSTVDAAKITFPTARRAPPVSYVLEDANGVPYGTDNFDLALYVPAPSHREDGKPSWLALGNSRKRIRVELGKCAGVAVCIVQARRIGEQADAIPADACVLEAHATGCTLFLRPGRYEAVAVDGAETVVDRVPLAVK